MQPRQGDLLQDIGGGPSYWQVDGPVAPAEGERLPGTRLYWLVDRRPEMAERRMWALVLDYRAIPRERLSWDVPGLRRAFGRMVEALCRSQSSFLPEPVDYLQLEAAAGELPPELCRREPVLVLAPPAGRPLRPLPPKMAPEQRLRELKKVCLDAARALRALHRSQVVLRQLPLGALVEAFTTRRLYCAGLATLMPMADFAGFNPHQPGLHAERRWAAPECFAAAGFLSPAADVYALGRMLLAFLGEQPGEEVWSRSELQASFGRLALPEPWRRLFLLCLHPDPAHRFHDCGELIRFVASGGEAEPTVGPASIRLQAPGSAAGRGALGQGARPTPAPRPATRQPDRPQAALLLATDIHPEVARKLDYRKVLAHFQPRYSLDPLLAFVKEQREMDNPFYGLLRDRLGCELVVVRRGLDLRQLARELLPGRLLDAEAVIVVGEPTHPLVQALLDLPALRRLTCHLVPAGPGPVPAGVQVVEAETFFGRR